jgi:protein phosphatase
MNDPLIVTVAPPGAGKSTWVSARFPRSAIVSLDRFRYQLTDSTSDQTANKPAVQMMHVVLASRSERGLLTVVDATNYLGDFRRNVFRHARRWGRTKVAVWFNVTPDECLRRQAGRTRQVPPDVIERMHQQIQNDAAGLAAEVDLLVTVDADGLLSTDGRPIPPALRERLWLPA